ncbi:MAG TPA: hypothetical protein VF468_15915 [Actinomycetota bacterium]|nr:hypothetical protein [Actinomycetota bacterium]
MTRDEKLAQLAEIAVGIRYGMAAFDERLDEMGPGIGPRGNGRGAKGGVSRPVETEALAPFPDECPKCGAAVPAGSDACPGCKHARKGRRPAPVVTSARLDRIVDAAHALILDLDAAYGEIARAQRGLPAKGEPSCGWCQEAVHAAAKVEAKEGKAPIPLDYRSRTYLFAQERKGDKVVGKVLVCEWCYRFDKRHDRKPTIEERWIHAQGGRMPKVPRMKAAPRVKAS